MYFNLYLYPVWAIGMLCTLVQKIPQLAGFLLLTMCPIVPTIVYYIIIQGLGSGSTSNVYPFEIAVNGLYAVFVCVELYWSYRTTNKFIRVAQARAHLYMDPQLARQSSSEVGAKSVAGGSSFAELRIARSARIAPE
ncbi:hypothetical protein RI367_002041 [Sorochytrium milnesiophthora]